MPELVIIFYTINLQLGIGVIATGIITYLRYKKESLKYFLLFLISMQFIQTELLFKACLVFSGKESFLLLGIMRFFDFAGMLLMLYVLCIFPFYIKGGRPNKWLKLTSAIITFLYMINYVVSLIIGQKGLMMINRLITSVIILYTVIFILLLVRNIGNAVMRKAMLYLGCISILFISFIFAEFISNSFLFFQNLWFIEPLSLPAYLFVLSCSGFYLVRKYFNVPSFIDLETNKLSEYFIERFNITAREAEIIVLLRKGKIYKEIAEELSIAFKTVDTHIQNIYVKTGVNNKKQLLNLIDTSYI